MADVVVVEDTLLVEVILVLGDDGAGHDELRPFTQYLFIFNQNLAWLEENLVYNLRVTKDKVATSRVKIRVPCLQLSKRDTVFNLY